MYVFRTLDVLPVLPIFPDFLDFPDFPNMGLIKDEEPCEWAKRCLLGVPVCPAVPDAGFKQTGSSRRWEVGVGSDVSANDGAGPTGSG